MVHKRVIFLDEEAFGKFLKRGGRSQSATKRFVSQVGEFERYLREKRDCKELDSAKSEDLEAFVSYIEEKRRDSARNYLHSIGYCYEHSSNEEMCNFARKLRRQRITQKPRNYR